MKTSQTLAALVGMATMAQAHMEMIWPPAFKSKANPFAGQDIDYSMTAPLSADGSNFPCKGYQSLLGTAAGASVADWTAGETYNMTITGSAIHGGGSCQASLSYDKGKTWTVIHSYIGNCPTTGPVDLEFAVPSDTPAGEAVFAWTWMNQIGNREMYMNCAAVTIAGGSSKARSVSDSFSGRPAMFVANVNNGCSTSEGKDLKFPDPGPDVTTQGDNTAPPVGSCAEGSGSSDGGDDGGDAPTTTAETPAPITTSAPEEPKMTTTSAPADTEPTTTVYVSSENHSIGKTTSLPSFSPGGIFITVSDTPGTETTQPADPAATTSMSTMVTITTPSTPSTPTIPSTPNPTPTTGGGSGGSGGSFAQGTPCTEEGDWNCVGGSQFQRCASGMWSALISMAGGTSCSPGQSATLVMHRKRGGSRIYAEPWKV